MRFCEAPGVRGVRGVGGLVRVLVLAATAALLAGAPAAAQVSPPDQTITVSDGVNIVAGLTLPGDGRGRYPVVVDLEPYGRSTSTRYVAQGFARLNADVRGSGKSGGALCLLCNSEQQDVHDVVEWAARQPWSNGHVALYGYSYSAITALLGAAKQPPHLDAVVVGHPPTDPYRDVVWHHGLFDQGFVYQWFAGQTLTQALGLGDQPQYLDRAQQEFAVQTREVPLYGPLYEERSVLAKADRIKVPVYVFAGWEDMYSRGDVELIDALASQHKALWIDASTHHGTGQFGHVGAPYDDGSSAIALSADPPDDEDVKWLQHFVQGEDNGIDRLPRVRYFDLGDRSWHAAPSWRSVTSRNVRMYLSGARSGTAKLSPNDGTLADAVPTGRASYQESYLYNPAAGISVPVGKDGPDGFLPYITLDSRLDEPLGLTWTSPPLRDPLPLAGPSELRLYALTEASDMAWVARLLDVAPDGSTRPITQVWLRASYRYVDPARSRDGAPYLPDDRVLPVTIGLITEYRMDLWDIAYTLPAGHRLRLWLGSSDTPTHEPLLVAGRNLVIHDAEHPTQLILGTRLPGDAAATAARRCRSRTVHLPRWSHLRVVANGRRLKVSHRTVRIRPARRARRVTVRISGRRHGHRRHTVRHVRMCGVGG
jgi:putative CocE/NonD family hydrolase